MKKQILFINGHLNTGGVERSLLDILRHVDTEKYNVELLLLEEFGAYAADIPEGIQLRLVDLRNTYGSFGSSLRRCVKAGDWRCLWVRIILLLRKHFGADKLRWASTAILGKKSYDCIIGFRPGMPTDLAAYAPKAKCRLGWWHHGQINLNADQQAAYLQSCLRLDQLITVSEGCKHMLQINFPALQQHISVIPNMLDSQRVRQQALAYTPFSKQDGITDIVSLGRLAPEKHLENTILAAQLLRESGFDTFRWFIIGDGSERDTLESLVSEKKLEKHFFFIGSLANPYPYVRQADLLVHSSYVESQCLVVLEAMALGTPCVVTDSLGPREFCADGENCILVQPGHKALAEGIRRILETDPAYLRKQGYQTAATYAPEQIMHTLQLSMK